MSSNLSNGSQASRSHNETLQQISHLLSGLRYGSVNIIVQDGVVVQIDRTEKHRVRGTVPAEANRRTSKP